MTGYLFSGEMWHWRGPAPFQHAKGVSEEIKEDAARLSCGCRAAGERSRWSVAPGDVEWKTAIFPKDGVYLVPIKEAVRKALDFEVGVEIAIELEVVER